MTTGTLPPLPPVPPEDDEVAVPHFEDALLGALLAEQSVATGRAGGLRRRRAASAPDPSARPRRALVAAAVLAAVGVGAAAVGLSGGGTELMAVMSGGDDTTPSSLSPEEEAARAEAVAQADAGLPEERALVTPEARAAAEAIDAAVATSVVHQVADHGESWWDASTGSTRIRQEDATGATGRDTGLATAPGMDDPLPRPDTDDTVVVRTVDHCLRTASEEGGPPLIVGGPADTVQYRLETNTLLIGDVVEVDGRRLTRLESNRRLPPEYQDIPGVTIDPVLPDGQVTYLDEDLLPVLVVDEETGERTTLEYLPRSPETLDLLVPPVPDGFTATDARVTDTERIEQGCPPDQPLPVG